MITSAPYLSLGMNEGLDGLGRRSRKKKARRAGRGVSRGAQQTKREAVRARRRARPEPEPEPEPVEDDEGDLPASYPLDTRDDEELEDDRERREMRAGLGDTPYLFQEEIASPEGSRVDDRLVAALERRRRRLRAELGLAGFDLDLPRLARGAGAADTGAQVLRRVTLRTTVTPALTMRPGQPAQAGGGGFGAWILRQLRPDLEAETALGTARHAPYGPSDGELVPVVAVGALALGASGAYLIVKGLAAVLRERRKGAA